MPGEHGSDEASQYDTALAALSERERIFVRLVLQGLPHDQAADRAGWTGDLAAVRALGTPRVQAALETLAPLLGSDAEAVAALRPLLRARLMRSAQGKSALAAIRDFLLLGTPGAPESEALRAWQDAQDRRAAQRAGAAAGARGKGAPAA